MGRTFEEILNEMYPSVADNDGKDGANTAIPSFVSDYSEEGKQKDIKEDNLAFEQMQKHTGVIAPEEVEKIEAPKTYNEIYEETSKDVLASDLARKGVSVFNFDKMMKESAKSFNMENWQKTKRIADAKASDNVSADDVDSTIKDIFAQTNKNDLVDVEDVLSSLRYKDAEGNTYYGFKGKRLYGDDLARDIVGNYVDERNHWINMGDSAYREQWSQNKYGIPYEEFVKGRVEYLEDKFKPVVEAAEVYYEEQGKIPQMSLDGEPIVDNIALELGKLRSATNAFRDNTFWRGVEAGLVEAIRTATFDFGGVLVSAEQEDALNKYLKGEELNAKERLLVEMAKYNQILGEEKSKYRKGFDAADVGEGLIGSIGFMASLGAQSALGVGKSIGKELAEASVKEAFNRSIKEGVKLGLAKTGAWMGNTSARTALSTMPYQDYAQRRLSHFQFTDNGLMKEEVNPFADMYRAYASTFAEIAAEDFGGLLDDGMKAFGVKMANAKFFNKLADSKLATKLAESKLVSKGRELANKAGDKLKDFTPAQAVIGGLKGMKLNSMVGEVAEEYVTAAIQPLVTGEFFSTINEDGLMPAFNKHYADALTSEFAFNTFAVCGALSAGGTLVKGVSGAMTAVEITNLRKDTKELLEGISDESLRNTLYTAINSNEADRFAPLAQMKWNSISADDASAALKVIFNDAKTHALRGEAMETERLMVFSPYLLGAINKSYRGVDVANPTPTTEIIEAYAKDEAGNEVPIGNVIYGDMDNPNAIVQVVDANGMVRNVPVAGTKFIRTSLSDYISEQYAMMFSTSISKERLNELIENVRGITKMDKEAYDKVLEENGFRVYRKGENVVLADGRFGTVRGGADSGSYIVDVTDANGNKTTELVGFESILHPTDLSMAEAQAEAQAEGSMDAPIVLPTTKDGRVSLDGINDGKVLARVLPSQMGGKQKAIEAIDAEIQRLETEQSKPTKQTGLDAMAEASERAESTASRIKVLEDARKILAEEVETSTPSAEDVERKRKEQQEKMDAMSTFDFSRDYRRRNLNTKVSHNALHKLIDNINEELKQVTDEAERKVLEHRKAQYEQTLKDMGATEVVEGFQEGEIGGDKEFKALVEKASEALGLPIIVTDEPFANSRQNGMHRVSKDGNAIYINSRSTKTEQSVGILAHEIVHEFKQFLTPEEWAKFEGVIMTARFGKDWANSEAYKKEIESIQDAERKSGHTQGVSDDKAREEAVAYAIQDYIFNGADGVRAFEAIVNQNLNWRDKLIEALRKVVDKLKSLFGKLDAEQGKAVQEAIAEFENVFKRYAQKSGEIKAEQIEGETAAIINEKDGQSSFSLSTYEDGGRDILQNFLTSQVEGGKLDQKDANAILTEMDAIYDICMDYKDEYAPFGAWSEAAVVRDDEGMPVFSVIKENDEYKMNLDFSLVCKKRRTLDAVLNEMIGRKLIEIAPDDPTFIAKVNDVVRKYGFETACRLCFVDAKRFRVVSTARNFCKLYNGVVAKLMPTDKKVAINSFDAAGVGYPTHEGSLDTLADSELNIKALEDILKRNGEKTVIAKIARHLLEHPEDRKLVHISDFVSTRGFDPTKALNPQILSLYNSKKGSGGPKASFSDVQYLNDVAYANWDVDKAYAVGGVRVQSFSDYVPRMVFDYMQMVADLAAKRMPVHAYTKEAAFAKTFGLTGMKINMSLVPTVVEGGIAAGLDADGNYVWEKGETFDYDTAIEIQNADGYRENCGTIAVGASDAHIEKMLDDENIRMIIPYHKSGLNPAVAKHNNIAEFKDYTNQQSTRYANGTKLTKADEKHTPNFYENTRILGDPRKAADAYLAWCKENNYKPKFDKWASHPNYYKLLEDFTTLVDGEYFEQRGVTMTFPKEGDAFGSLSNLIAESLEEDAVLEGKRDSLVGAMVDEIESTLFSNREKALETSNSLQKQPNTQEVVSEADVVEESFSISRNNEATIDKWLGKREDFTDEVKSAFKEYIADFKPATQLATTKWFANGVIRIPEDMPKVEQAMEIAQRKKVDALQYNSPMELIEQFGVVAPKEKLINPDDVPTLSNKVQVPNTDITIYDVENSEKSRKAFRELMNSHLGKESSPWCLLQADKNGVLTKESARYWKHYNKYPKRAAFSNGKLVAFFASDDKPTWWDRMDKPHSEIPIVGKIKGDELGRTATMLYNESGELAGYEDIHKGNMQNGLYEEWYDLEHIKRRGHFVNGSSNGVFEKWHPNGVLQSYAEFEDGFLGKLVKQWNTDGVLIRKEMRDDAGEIGAREYWNEYSGVKSTLSIWNIQGDGVATASFRWDVNGSPSIVEHQVGDTREVWNYIVHDRYQTSDKEYDWGYDSFVNHKGIMGVTSYRKQGGDTELVDFADKVHYERKGAFGKNVIDLYSLTVGDKEFDITISLTIDGEQEMVAIVRKFPDFTGLRRYAPFASIQKGERNMPMGITDAMVDEVMAEVMNRLDVVNKVAFEVQEDAKKQKARAEKIREMYHADKVADIESIEDVDKMLEQISNDLASTKDSFSIDRSQSAEEIASLAESEGTTSFSLVRDEAKIAELEASPKRIGYRNVILNEDGSFSSPMATHIGNTGKGKVKSATFNLGEWEEAEENPQLVDEQGKVYIYKDNGGSVKVAYDPYIHNRLDKVNAQFKEAWKRPNLVYVETEVPITDLESGYHADKAKLPVGVHSWSNGDLMLSRYDKPIRIVSWEEVADDWVARFKDRGVEFDIVPPALLPILKERGVEILPPHKGLGADATEAYEASRTEQESFSILREEDTDTIFATAKEEFASTNDWLKTGWLMPDGTQLDFAEGGDYRGTDHRAIGAAYKGVAEHQWQYLQDFESRGGIRIHMNRDGKYGTIEMTIKPTAEQKKRLRSFIGAVGGNVDVDFMDENYNTAHSASYEGVSPARVLSGITNFYDEGIKPKGNVSYSLERTNEQFNSKLSALTEENSRSIVLNLGMPSAILISCGVDNKPIRLYGAKLLAKAKKHNYDVNDLRDLPLYIAAPIAVFKGVYEGSFAILTEVKIGERNVLAALTVGKGGHDVEFNIVTSVYDKRQDSLVRWINNGRLLYADKEKALNYFSVSAPIAEAQNNQELVSATKLILNFENPKLLEEKVLNDLSTSAPIADTLDNQELNSVDKDTTINPKNQISEQDSFSLNRDNTTVATPELEAEANEELSKEMELIEQLDEAQTALDRLRSKIDKRNQRKEMTFDEVRKFLLDSDTLQGLQEASKGQYNRIIKNVLNTLEKMPEKRIAVKKLIDKVQEALTSARLGVADSNLKAVGKDFANVIKKKRDGKNSKGEKIEDKIADEYNEKFKTLLNFIKPLFTDKDKIHWSDILRAGTILPTHIVNGQYVDPIQSKINELYEELVDTSDADKELQLELLDFFMQVRLKAQEVSEISNKQKDVTFDLDETNNKIDKLESLIELYESGEKGFGQALRDIKAMGYKTIGKAKDALNNLKVARKAYGKEMKKLKGDEANAKSALVDAARNFNVALKSFDKEGRIALREKQAKRKESEMAFRKGILRSVRNPLYQNTMVNEPQVDGKELSNREKQALTRRGTSSLFGGMAETFEFGARKLDVNSIPNEWLEYGFYYQFLVHPESGIMARMDWRYKTEKALREKLNQKVKEIFGTSKVKEFFGINSIEQLKGELNAKTGIVRTVVQTKVNGETVAGAEPSTIDLTVQQLLYIRAMLKQDNGIAGYLALGLDADDIKGIARYVEEKYPEFCELADWVMGKDGILEEIYAIRNPIYKGLNGVNLDHTSEYFPIRRAKHTLHSAGQSIGEQINPSTIAGGIGSNKKRIRNSAPMDINVGFFDVLEQHINESMAWCASAELVHKMNILLGSPAFVKMLKAQGVDMTIFKNNFLRAIGESIGDSQKRTTPAKFVTSLARSAVAANVAFNPNAALKQILSGTAVLSQEVDPRLWVEALKNILPSFTLKTAMKVFQNGSIEETNFKWWRNNIKWAMENIPTFAERADSGRLGFDIFELDGIETWDKYRGWITSLGLAANKQIDLFTCAFVGKTYYDYQYKRNLDRRLTPDQAHKDACVRASILINQTQQSSVGAFLSARQRDKKGDVGEELFRMGITAYQNSALAFDRNVRASAINLTSMLLDNRFAQEKGRAIRYKAEEYMDRGMSEKDANKKAKKDWKRSVACQFNQLFHNLILNNTLWRVGGVVVGTYVSALLVGALGGDDDDYGEEVTEIAWDKVNKEMLKELVISAVYAMPGSSNPLLKPFYEETASKAYNHYIEGGKKQTPKALTSVTAQPINDLIDFAFKVGDAYSGGYEDEETKQEASIAFGMMLVDATCRYGLGISTRTLKRMYNGVAGEGNIEDFMNLFNSPRGITKLFAGRPRKDETMEQYVERVGGAYKIINGRYKGEDVSKLRKQYIDRMDEIMFYDTDFDYDKFKEDKKRVERLSKGLVYSATYNDKANEYRYRLKENKADKLESMSDEQSVEEAKLAEIKANVNYIDKFLKANVGWDTDMAEERELLFRAEQEHIDNFLNEYANYKNIK